jgi:23S rRNA (cytosine1962-C5)-methyltransferase
MHTVENRIVLQSGKRGRIAYGHPWIYRSQIKDVSQGSPGQVYDVFSPGGRFLGRGYYNPKSEIAVRLLTEKEEAIDEGFFERRVEEALAFRRAYVRDTNAYRIVFSESDALPGLIIDSYSDHVVFQILTLGMEVHRDLLIEVMRSCVGPKFIFEKSDVPSRRLEGLEAVKRWWGEEGQAEIEISEGEVKFLVDIEGGHKTGFYLDQRESRQAIRGFAEGKRVLDCFSYTGGFALYAALHGAREVVGIDIHESQITLAKRNARLNGIPEERIDFRIANAFDALKEFDKSNEKFDVVILDPPSFVKHKNGLEGALSGYKEINLRAMRILNEGGILATFSCSGHMDEELFLQVVLDAAFDTKRNLKVLRRCGQSLDHPIDPFIPQTSYLKGFIVEVR